MARIRTIKPDFWVDEKVVECTAFARLCFIGLWNFSDDDGRMEYRPKKIKMQIFPADDVDISGLIGELRGERLVELYSVDNKEYLRVCGFHKHQKIDRRLSSKHPPPPRITPNHPDGREGKGREVKEHMSDSDESDALFETEYQAARKAYKPRNRNDNQKRAWDAWKARVREHINPADLLLGIRRYSKRNVAESTPPDKIMHMSTFLNADKSWEQPWAAVEKVPTDLAAVRRLVAEKNIEIPDNSNLFEARKIIANETGMSL